MSENYPSFEEFLICVAVCIKKHFTPKLKCEWCKISLIEMWKKLGSKLAHCSFAFPSFQHISFGNHQSIKCIILNEYFPNHCALWFYPPHAKPGFSACAENVFNKHHNNIEPAFSSIFLTAPYIVGAPTPTTFRFSHLATIRFDESAPPSPIWPAGPPPKPVIWPTPPTLNHSPQ